jgi:hypothetical protein
LKKGRTRTHSLNNWLWKKLWACRTRLCDGGGGEEEEEEEEETEW